MAEILVKAASFVAIIILGYVLRRKGLFKQEDFHVLSKIVLKITLPAAIVSNFSGIDLKPSMLLLSALGLGGGVLLITSSLVMNAGKSRNERAFGVINLSGYNIGNFTMPFAQGFLGPMGVVATSLFDAGNAFVCLGGSYSIASMIKGGDKKFSIMPILRTLVKSVPFDAYVVMTVLSLLHLSMPSPIVSFAGIIANANAFLAMFMIGVGFKLSGDMSQTGKIAKILLVRYGISIALAAAFFFLLPLDLGYRQALAILSFSPIASAAPAFTADLKEDFGLASAINSISIVISIVLITVTLILIL
ncbi:AEC family transporter [Lacrimispora sp. 210928-DFI.3.58]|uniref:AEC family transporter n=1 Tax=Lacrimispora sp. 210928-DFI.3.58 TaxID=2883214 RepID=UPI0015B64D6D|nr:AEC family transporter [Lacrimispora sp. 210928-DFI.3.58]MCB7317202.1 AEC family transporter [Lacrimispora sp. 210928-DFI.3.58]